jgi:hypothetical protein
MKALFSTCAAFVLAGAMAAPAALAQPTAVTPQQEALGLPSGPYLLSCTRPHVVNGSLVALCDDRASATQDAVDTWRMAQMPLAEAQQCNGAIADTGNGRLTCGTAPMAGSSMAPQNYGSSFGTSGSPYVPPYSNSMGSSAPGLPGYQSGAAPGYPNGQPVPSANKPYYSPPSAGSSMAPQNYGSSFGTSGAPYGSPTGYPYYLNPPYPNRGQSIPGVNGNQPIGWPGTPSNPT